MTTTRAQAQITTDGWTATVEHVGTFADPEMGNTRNRWRWTITSTTDAAEWMPVRTFTGDDLTSAIDVRDPDPIGALVSLGGFLGHYSEHVDYWSCDHSEEPCPSGDCAVGMFPGLDPEVAGALSEAVAIEFPDPDGECLHGYNDGGPCPTCDVCDRSQCSTEGLEWNGETGNHVACETPCEGCNAEPGEPCRPGCLSGVEAPVTCDCPCHDTDVEPWASHTPDACVCAAIDGMVAP